MLNENTVGSAVRRMKGMKGDSRTLGPGIDPKRVPKLADAVAVTKAEYESPVDFENQWQAAHDLELEAQRTKDFDKAMQALKIFKSLSDVNPVSGLRSVSFFQHRGKGKGKGKDKLIRDKLYIVCDLDNLKFINTILGHSGANGVIYHFGKILQKYFEGDSSRHEKTYHPHGDEFIVVIDITHLGSKELKVYIDDVIDRMKLAVQDYMSIRFHNPNIDQEDREDRDSGEKGMLEKHLAIAKNGMVASVTMGLSFNYSRADHVVDEHKKKRKQFITLVDYSDHILVLKDIRDFLNDNIQEHFVNKLNCALNIIED